VVKGPAEMMREPDVKRHSRCQVTNTERRRFMDVQPQFDEHAFRPQSAIILPDSPSIRQRLQNRSPSSPPSARMLLRSNELLSPHHNSSSPVFQFGHEQSCDLHSPDQDHDWGEAKKSQHPEGEMDTLRPSKQPRQRLASIFSSPLKEKHSGAGGREYDPESAGQGLVFFQRMGDVAIADTGGGGGSGEDVDTGGG
jgi:hypothetical protein